MVLYFVLDHDSNILPDPTNGPGDLLSKSSSPTRDHHQTYVSRSGAIYLFAMLNFGDRDSFPNLGYLFAKRYVELPLRRLK